MTMCWDYTNINLLHSHLYPNATHNTLLITVVDHLSLNLKIFKEKEVNIDQFVSRYIHRHMRISLSLFMILTSYPIFP